MMQGSKVLRRAAELVDTGHSKGRAARDEDGRGCSPLGYGAVSWCLTGAIERAWQETNGGALGPDAMRAWSLPESIVALFRAAAAEAGILAGTTADWNNAPERTGAEVAALLRRAAEIAEG